MSCYCTYRESYTTDSMQEPVPRVHLWLQFEPGDYIASLHYGFQISEW